MAPGPPSNVTLQAPSVDQNDREVSALTLIATTPGGPLHSRSRSDKDIVGRIRRYPDDRLRAGGARNVRPGRQLLDHGSGGSIRHADASVDCVDVVGVQQANCMRCKERLNLMAVCDGLRSTRQPDHAFARIDIRVGGEHDEERRHIGLSPGAYWR